MNIVNYFNKVRTAISDNQLEAIANLQLDKPLHFNWVEEIFYELNVKAFPESTALIWRYKSQERYFSFLEIYEQANQLLNFMRRHGCQQGDRIYSFLPLIPANWTSFLATIKGGFIIMPTATNLTARDLESRIKGQ